MYYYAEVAKAIIKHEQENFGTEFSISDVKNLYRLVEKDFNSCWYNYIEPECKTKYTYVVLHKDEIDEIWGGQLLADLEERYLNKIPAEILEYFEYDKYLENTINETDRAEYFNSYDGYTEIESYNYYIYYHNRNY